MIDSHRFGVSSLCQEGSRLETEMTESKEVGTVSNCYIDAC